MRGSRRYWIGVASKDHVSRGVQGGFMQLCHGKDAPLKRMSHGDGIVYYCPRTVFPDGPAYRRFGAIGHVIDEAPYQIAMAPNFRPFRRNVKFLQPTVDGVQDALIEPLIPHLSFIQDKSRWGGV
eukprot:PhF_6_TR23766/c0_g1_i2/m.33229